MDNIQLPRFESCGERATDIEMTIQHAQRPTATTTGTKKSESMGEAYPNKDQETRQLLDTASLLDRAVADELFLKTLKMNRALPFGSCAGTKTLYRVVFAAGSWFRTPSHESPPEGVTNQSGHLMGAVITSNGHNNTTMRGDAADTTLPAAVIKTISTENTTHKASVGKDTLSDSDSGVSGDSPTHGKGYTQASSSVDKEVGHLFLTPDTSPDNAKKGQAGFQHNANKLNKASTPFVFFEVGRLEMLDLLGVNPVVDDEDGDVGYIVDFPHGHEIDDVLDNTDKTWKEKVDELQTLRTGEWLKWSLWKKTGFVVVTHVGPEGTSDGVYIVADCENPVGVCMSHYNCGRRFAWARVGDCFQNMEYNKELEMDPSTIATGQMKIVYVKQDKDGVFQSLY